MEKLAVQVLTQNTADFQLTGKVSSIGIYGYNYVNIETDARFASGLFRGYGRNQRPQPSTQSKGIN